MTMEELNAIYNNMSVYGDTYNTAPTTTIPTDPNAGQPPILEPLIPALPMQYINENDDNDDRGITTLKNNIGPKYNLKGLSEGINPSNNKIGILQSLLSLPGQAIGAYMKYGPIGQVKRGIEFVKEKQKVAAENQRLEALAQIEQARKQKESQAIIDAALKKQMQDTGVTGDNYNQAANIRGGGGGNTATNSQGQTAREATYDGNKNTGTSQGYSQHYAKGGRVRYGTGGIVTL